MKTCPTPGCGSQLADKAVACNDCGWEAPKRGNAAKERDPSEFVTITYAGGATVTVSRCCDVDQGLRCAEPGTLSMSTHASDKTLWYCRKHFPPFRGHVREQSALPLGGFKPLRELVKPKLLDPEAALERQAIQGEHASTETDTRAPA
jgi:hypothetical protein